MWKYLNLSIQHTFNVINTLGVTLQQLQISYINFKDNIEVFYNLKDLQLYILSITFII